MDKPTKRQNFAPQILKIMVVVTGAYGFIGSCLVSFLNQKGVNDIVAVDDFSKTAKAANLVDKKVRVRLERTEFPRWFAENGPSVSFVFHIGARTDTTEFDYQIHDTLNVQYSKVLSEICTKYSIPIIYASSAATYGEGELGYSDEDDALPFQLHPLNPYGVSKNEFDKWVLTQAPENLPPFWAGLKFFNVYGPNEYHKGRMASTIFHFFHQINREGAVNLFKSHRPDYKDGEQMRDFVYVKDVLNVLFWLYEHRETVRSGLYNLGTGQARTFNDLVANVFKNLDKPLTINYVPTPEDIRDKYQYFTEATMNKLRTEGYTQPFFTLEEGIADYVNHYLVPNAYF